MPKKRCSNIGRSTIEARKKKENDRLRHLLAFQCDPTSNCSDQEAVVSPVYVSRNRKRNTMDGGETAGKQQLKIERKNNFSGEPPQRDHVVVYNAAEPEVSILETKEELSIGTTDQALKQLRALQDFAMIQNNFRAIGLLMQAEHAIQYPPKAKDFEVDQ